MLVAEFFRGLQSRRDSVGGVVAEIFRGLRKPARFTGGGIFSFWGPKHILDFPKGGGPGPPGPPPESATELDRKLTECFLIMHKQLALIDSLCNSLYVSCVSHIYCVDPVRIVSIMCLVWEDITVLNQL